MKRIDSVRKTVSAFLPFLLFLLLSTPILTAQDNEGEDQMDEGEEYAKTLEESYEAGISYLMDRYMEEEGAWPGFKGKPDVAFTAFAVKILAEGPAVYLKENLDKFKSGVEYLLDAQQDDGSIIDADKLPKMTNYKSSLGLMALAAAQEAYPKWEAGQFREPILNAREFLVGTQFSPGYHDVGKDHWAYGGFDYDPKAKAPDADMSNSQFAIQALHAANLPEDHPAWKRAVMFLKRSQNRSESNDLKEYFKEKGLTIGDDGGFMYYPGKSYGGVDKLPDGNKVARSYGSMTYAGLKSYIYAQLEKGDPKVKAAFSWIQSNYTLERNPGMKEGNGNQGLFYYYHTFAKALSVWGETVIQDDEGNQHHWSRELVDKLVSLQQDDGSWKNNTGRWREDNPALVTNYCLLALNICRKWVEKE